MSTTTQVDYRRCQRFFRFLCIAVAILVWWRQLLLIFALLVALACVLLGSFLAGGFVLGWLCSIGRSVFVAFINVVIACFLTWQEKLAAPNQTLY